MKVIDKIKEFDIEQLAKILVKENIEEDIDYDFDDNPTIWFDIKYISLDGSMFWDYDLALKHNCELLNRNFDKDTREGFWIF